MPFGTVIAEHRVSLKKEVAMGVPKIIKGAPKVTRLDIEEPAVLKTVKPKGEKARIEYDAEGTRRAAKALASAKPGGREKAGLLGGEHKILGLSNFMGIDSNQKFTGVAMVDPNRGDLIAMALSQGLKRAGMYQGKVVYCQEGDVDRLQVAIARETLIKY